MSAGHSAPRSSIVIAILWKRNSLDRQGAGSVAPEIDGSEPIDGKRVASAKQAGPIGAKVLQLEFSESTIPI
jgi:hypothetical protein